MGNIRRTRNLQFVLAMNDSESSSSSSSSRRARSMPLVQPLLEMAIRAENGRICAEFEGEQKQNPRTPSLSGLALFAQTPLTNHNKGVGARGFASSSSRKGGRLSSNLCAPQSFGVALIADLLQK